MAGIKGKRIIKVQPKNEDNPSKKIWNATNRAFRMMRMHPDIRRAMYAELENESHKTDKKEES